VPSLRSPPRRLCPVDSISGTITRNWDDLDRLKYEQTPQGRVDYTYDDAGRRTEAPRIPASAMESRRRDLLGPLPDRAEHLRHLSIAQPTRWEEC
jgi:YD repeat-containing protein